MDETREQLFIQVQKIYDSIKLLYSSKSQILFLIYIFLELNDKQNILKRYKIYTLKKLNQLCLFNLFLTFGAMFQLNQNALILEKEDYVLLRRQ